MTAIDLFINISSSEFRILVNLFFKNILQLSHLTIKDNNEPFVVNFGGSTFLIGK